LQGEDGCSSGWVDSRHTSLGVDLERIAAGSGIQSTATIMIEEELADGAPAAGPLGEMPQYVLC